MGKSTNYVGPINTNPSISKRMYHNIDQKQSNKIESIKFIQRQTNWIDPNQPKTFKLFNYNTKSISLFDMKSIQFYIVYVQLDRKNKN